MSSYDLFNREEILGGLTAQRARTLLYLIESRTAHLVARSGSAMARYLTEQAAEQRDMAFIEAFTAGVDPPIKPTIQDLERYAHHWASLVPDNPQLRANLAHLLGEKYRFAHGDIPAIRRILNLDQETVQVAYQQLYANPLAIVYEGQTSFLERLRWSWASLTGKLERLPPFWTAFSLTLTETVGAGILALPIALAGVGPLVGVFLLILMGLINVVTIAYMAEAVTRNGNIRYGNAYFGRLVSDFLGRDGSLVLTLALVLINLLALFAYFIGLATTIESATHLPAVVWATALFLINLLFLKRENLNATVSTALVIGIINIGLILGLSAVALPKLQLDNFSLTNLVAADNRPFDISILEMVFGVILIAYFGHTSMGNCAKVVLRREPGGRSLLLGSVAAQVAAILLYSIWVIAVNGSVPADILSVQSGTALIPLAEVAGPLVHVFGTLFVVLAMGMGSVHLSLGSFNLVREWLPRSRRSVKLLLRRRGQVLLQPARHRAGIDQLGLIYLGSEGSKGRFRLEIQSGTRVYHSIAASSDRLEGEDFLKNAPDIDIDDLDLSIKIDQAQFDKVSLQITTSMKISLPEEWDTSGLNLVDALELPEGQGTILAWIIRNREVSLEEAQAKFGTNIQPMLEALALKGYVQSLRKDGELMYTASLAPKRGRQLPPKILNALGTETRARPAIATGTPLSRFVTIIGNVLLSARGRFYLGVSPLAFVFLFSAWLLLTNAESFTQPLSFLGVISVSILAGVFPALLLVASRRKGERLPGVVYRILGHPILLLGTVFISLSGLFIHGLVIWNEPVKQALVIFVGLSIVVIMFMMFRRKTFTPRVIVEIRQDQPASNQAALAIVSSGQPLPVEFTLSYADQNIKLNASISELHNFAKLRHIHMKIPTSNQHDLKVWAHRITSQGDSESLKVGLEVNSPGFEEATRINLAYRQAVIPISSASGQIELSLIPEPSFY